MTIEQTVEIPENRHVFFEFLAPIEIPVGLAKVEVKLMPVVEKSSSADNRKLPTPITDSLVGILASAGDISLEQIREERLAKYLK